MLNCHGSFATASCLRCRTQFPGSSIEEDIFASRVALCPLCTKTDEEEAEAKARRSASPKVQKKKKAPAGNDWRENDEESEDDFRGEWDGKPLVKPDIVFFG